MKHLSNIVFSVFIFIALPVLGENDYSVDNIDTLLIANADAVIRNENTTWEVIAGRKTIMKRHRVITVLNTDGLKYVDLRLHQDAFTKLVAISGNLYDAKGDLIRKFRKNEFHDEHYVDNSAVFTDIRILYTDLYYNDFPFTVEFNYTQEESNTLNNITWMPVYNTSLALEKASYSINVPSEHSIRYKANPFMDQQPDIADMGRGRTAYTWELKNLPAFKSEPLLPMRSEVLPMLMVGPNSFEYGGYDGKMDTWANFGLWIKSLNHNRQTLDEKTKMDINMIMDDCEGDTLALIRRIYEYVQQNTRYVNISLGIGGLQPMSAEQVIETRYGDCKALANFTNALLAYAGIRSHYAIIQSGSRDYEVDPEFPFNYFNHVIVCVPLGLDTIWLETTANLIPAGFIGESNSGRYVLLVTDEGGKLARTPELSAETSSVSNTFRVEADDNFNIDVNACRTLKGLAMDELVGIGMFNNQRQRDFFLRDVTLNNFELVDLEYTEQLNLSPFIEEKFTFRVKGYSRKIGNRYLVDLLPMLEKESSFQGGATRKYDFRLHDYTAVTDTVAWKLPSGFKPLSMPDPVTIDSPFGYYSITMEYNPDENLLTLVRVKNGRRGLFKAEMWSQFLEHKNEVLKHDQLQIMLVPEE